MNRTVGQYLKPWEHCPDCGALLMTAPGSLYCSHCGFEEAIFEGPVRFGPRGGRGLELDLEPADSEFAAEEIPAPVSEAA